MSTYDGALTVRDARAQYFAANGFDEGGYDSRWVKLQAGSIPLFLPNTAARSRAVRLHDVHHVVTEYDTTWMGEAEIAAWEIASGCAHHYAAWLLNLSAFAIGLLIAPRAVLRAFLRGRHSRDLYRVTLDDALLAEPVQAVRHRLGLDEVSSVPTVRDYVAFATWALATVLPALATLVLVVPSLVALFQLLCH